MATFAKPENALKRAEELINVGQKQDALQALHDLITSKRYRAWQKTHEKIMFKYIELCVDMRRGRFAKDDLIQYRIICQQREFEKRVVRRREAEYVRLRAEREERLSQVLKARKEERDMKRKMLYLRTEEERLTRLREEEEAQKRLEAERRKNEETERRAKLDEIAERQRKSEQELEERERLRKEAIIRGTPIDAPTKPLSSDLPGSGEAAPAAAAPAAAAAAAAPSESTTGGGKYVPKFCRGGAAVAAAPSESTTGGGKYVPKFCRGGAAVAAAPSESTTGGGEYVPKFRRGGAAVAAAPSESTTGGGKYVPKFRRGGAAAAPAPAGDKWRPSFGGGGARPSKFSR